MHRLCSSYLGRGTCESIVFWGHKWITSASAWSFNAALCLPFFAVEQSVNFSGVL